MNLNYNFILGFCFFLGINYLLRRKILIIISQALNIYFLIQNENDSM